ncbi:MAG: type I-MYXAN CRISPR-associated protein Cas6/Cmx6 [Betaproteobacteria bacterium]|nr:type I-MYXAN CRISPR-associated protein Cas6/Cmx6 [Betaproteobacteria bacterium]
MHWEENTPAEEPVVPDTVVDAVFGISCRTLPVDHAYALSQAIQRALPWFANEAGAGLHIIHVAGSGNGWQRPADPRALLHLSRRTKLALRIPKQRIAAANALIGQTLDVDGHALHVDEITLRPLSRITTLFSRYVLITTVDDEEGFLEAAAGQLGTLGVRPRKMLCGLTTPIATPARTLQARSLMIAGLSPGESVLLQQQGLGSERKLGCGVFLPHKDIDDLRRGQE